MREQQDHLIEAPPMTAKTYTETFDEHLASAVIKKSIDMSSEVATDFIEKTFKKVMKN